MTEHEAAIILNEHRSENPAFLRYGRKYIVRNDGRVDIWLPVGKSGLRWKSYTTVDGDDFILPPEVRKRATP